MERSDGWLWSNRLLGGSRLDYSFSIYTRDIGQVTPHCSDRAVFGMGNYHWNCFLTDPCGILTYFWMLKPSEGSAQASSRWSCPGQLYNCSTAVTNSARRPTGRTKLGFLLSFQLLTKWTYWRTGTQTLQGNVFPKWAAFLLGAICC